MQGIQIKREFEMQNLPRDREAILTKDLGAANRSSSQLSQLLADEALVGDEWDRAARILASCRQERANLNADLRRIDSIASAIA